MSFYDEVLRELLLALGAALFVGNLYALVRRRADHRRTVTGLARGPRPSRYRPPDRVAQALDLPEAPIGRSLVFLALGLVIMIWGLASLVAG
ncbi:MAG: hypothetical protein JWL73_1162 [Actinomycetia bacterium]|nr:hypothetical protein [Actinomycetes bacterium]